MNKELQWFDGAFGWRGGGAGGPGGLSQGMAGPYRLQAGYGRRCSGDVLEEVYLTERRNPIYL